MNYVYRVGHFTNILGLPEYHLIPTTILSIEILYLGTILMYLSNLLCV